MSHLTLEALARLIDETPDPTENGHLENCEQCREELTALRADAAALQLLPDPEPSIAQWMQLEDRLEREGLLRRHSRRRPQLRRIAAALVIFLLGGVSAALFMRQPQPYVARSETPAQITAPVSEPAVNPVATLAEQAIIPAGVLTVPAPTPVRPARTAEEAATQLRAAELDYIAAWSRFAQLSGRTEEGDPLARLAALESIVATTRAALGRAPADPVINGYHLTAVAQRDALLRHVSASQPTWY